VIESQWFYGLSLIIVVILDLITAIIRSSQSNENRIRGRSTGETAGRSDNVAPRQINSIMVNRAGLMLAHGFLHLVLIGLIFAYTYSSEGKISWLEAIVAIFLVMLLLLFEWIIGELAIQNPDRLANRFGTYSRAVAIIFYPLVFLPLKIILHLNENSPPPTTTQDYELHSVAEVSQEASSPGQGERKIIHSISRLGDTIAREIMVPRIDVTAVDISLPVPKAVDQLMKSGFSRVPVYEDTVDNVQGLLYTKDLLRVWREGRQLKSLRELLRPAYFVPEAKKVGELLSEMQSQRVHMAVVVDEYGGVAGLVTLEDIIEEIVGEIRDEFDQAEEMPYQQIGDGEYIFLGRIDLDDFNDIMGSKLTKDEADTLGGFIYNKVGRVPATDESIQVDGLLLTVEQVSGKRIRKIRARWSPFEMETEPERDDG